MSRRNPFKRSADVPRDVLGAARLGPGERVLAAAQTTDGRWLLGSRNALYVVPGAARVGPESSGTRIAWESVERADWDREGDRLVVSEMGEFGRVRPRHDFAVTEPGLLLELIRERVTASVVLQRRVLTDGKRGLFVIGRRSSTGEGDIIWAFEFDPGVDPEDPDVIAAAEAGLRAAQDEVGL